jgi:hypothetical protein
VVTRTNDDVDQASSDYGCCASYSYCNYNSDNCTGARDEPRDLQDKVNDEAIEESMIGENR